MEYSCPKCSQVFPPSARTGPGSLECASCRTLFDVVEFPAAAAVQAVPAPREALAEDSTCFFHTGNQAEVVCEGCGRFLCSVCAVPFNGRTLCAPCIAKERKAGRASATSITRYDSLACLAAFCGLVVSPAWPLSILASATAIWLAVYSWRKPKSLVGSGRPLAFVAVGTALLALTISTLLMLSMLNLFRAHRTLPLQHHELRQGH